MMSLVKDSIDACSTLRSGLPSVSEGLKKYMGRQLGQTSAANSLQELFVSYGNREHYSLKGLLCEMLLATLKEEYSRMGQRQAVFAEEQEVMLKEDGDLSWRSIKEVMRRL